MISFEIFRKAGLILKLFLTYNSLKTLSKQQSIGKLEFLTCNHLTVPETVQYHDELSVQAVQCRGSGFVLHLLSVKEISCNGGKKREKKR